MPPVEKQALECKKRHTAASAAGDPVDESTTPNRDGLSPREIEVLRRIAAGKTDKDIAAALFISVRTVNNHVMSIFRKTKTANRTEAAIYASQHGFRKQA